MGLVTFTVISCASSLFLYIEHVQELFGSLKTSSPIDLKPAAHHCRAPAGRTYPPNASPAAGSSPWVSHATHSQARQQHQGGEPQTESFLCLSGNACKCKSWRASLRKPPAQQPHRDLSQPSPPQMCWGCWQGSALRARTAWHCGRGVQPHAAAGKPWKWKIPGGREKKKTLTNLDNT